MARGKRKLYLCPNCGGCGCDTCENSGYVTPQKKRELDKQHRQPETFLVKEGRAACGR